MNLEDIFYEVCQHYDVAPKILKGKSKKQEHVIPRQMYIYLARLYVSSGRKPISYERIGRFIGRNHATAIYAFNKFSFQMTPQEVRDKNQILKNIYTFRGQEYSFMFSILGKANFYSKNFDFITGLNNLNQ